jgi:hypothetical protein
MARDESVTYHCDVCQKRVTAQQIRPQTGQPFYVRPPGWGAMSGIIQVGGDERVKDKWDFCSEACARSRFEELLEDAYQA